jgi:putative YjhG/YagF family dehydratase
VVNLAFFRKLFALFAFRFFPSLCRTPLLAAQYPSPIIFISGIEVSMSISTTPDRAAPVSVEADDSQVYHVYTHAEGPSGSLPLDEEFLRNAPSGDIFGLTQDAGMGWDPRFLRRPEFLILSTQGGIRAEDGSPIALGYHTGHWEVGLLMKAAAEEFARLGVVPFAGYVTDPCDGRSQGTAGMMDSLPYRNDAALVLRRLIRSLPTRRGVMGVATCDKGLPAMMLAIAGTSHLPGILVPGGVTLPPTHGEDAGKVQTIGVRFAQGEISLEEAAELGCRSCASPGGGCQFLGTAATSQVVAEALGMTLIHSALAPSGQPVWLDMARRSARALTELAANGIAASKILTEDALHNAMVVHAAFGGSTNLLLHIPAIAHAAGLPRPTVEDWTRINRAVPRLVDVLPNGPVGHPTVQVFMAGGVPEVMLHLRDLGLLRLDALTVHNRPLGDLLEEWAGSERRQRLRDRLVEADGIDPDMVILAPAAARARGLTSTVTFPRGNLAPEGSVVKSTAIDRSVVDADGIYRKVGPARVFASERAAIAAIKGQGGRSIQAGDIIVVAGRGPLGCGMEETYQLTSALKYLKWGKEVALVTDARFSGVSTGACIGHVGPEALAGGPVGRLREGDTIQIIVDTVNLEGSLDLVGHDGRRYSPEEGAAVLAARTPNPELAADERLPDDTRLWAALQSASGGTWGGCIYDVDRIIELLEAGQRALAGANGRP